MGGIGVLLPYRRTHPIPHLEDGEAGECETGRNGSARIGHRQHGFVAYCLHVRSRDWKRRSLLTFYELLAHLCLSGGLKAHKNLFSEEINLILP